MAVGIPATVRPTGGSLGNMNPLDMMKSMMEMRNLQAQYQGVMQMGRDFATSSNADDLRQKVGNNPFAGFAMQQYEQASAYYRNAAQTGEINQLVGVNRAKAAILGGTDQATTLKLLSDAEAAAPPSERTWMGHLYDSLSGPMSDEEFQNKKIGLGITFGGLSTQEAFGAQGMLAPQVVRAPGVLGGPEQLVQTGGFPPLAGGLGGTGAGAPGGALGARPLTPTPATGPQVSQWDALTKRQDDLENRVQAGGALIAGINEATKTLGAVETGPLTDLRTRAAAVARQLGFDEPTVGLIAGAKTDVAAAQEMDKLFNNFALSRLAGASLPGGRTLQQEYRDIVGSNPSLAMQLPAIQRILRMWQRSYVRDRMEQRFLSDYVTRNAGNPAAAAQWGTHWTDLQQRKGLLNPDWYAPGVKDKAISPGDVIKLLGNRSPENITEFERHYPGASRRYLEEDAD